MSQEFHIFLLKEPLRGSVEKLSQYFIKEYNLRFSFLIFTDIFSFFDLNLDEEKLMEKYRIFASTVIYYYSDQEILFKEWCWLIFLIIKPFIKNLYLNNRVINKVNKKSLVVYKICLEVIDLLREHAGF